MTILEEPIKEVLTLRAHENGKPFNIAKNNLAIQKLELC